MSAELVHVDSASHTFDLIPSAAGLADRIARTDFVPDGLRGKPEAVMAAMLKGHEIGMAPMQALSHIAVIKGRPTISAEGQRALVLAAGHSIRVKKLDPVACTLIGTRVGEPDGTEVTYTLDEAKKSGIARGNAWTNHPTDMLLARATTRLCRAVFPDVTGGLRSTEEVEDFDAEGGATTGTVKRRATASKAKAKPKADAPEPEAATEAEPAADLPPLPDEVEEAEVIEDPDRITDPQMKKLLVCFKEQGIEDRTERLAYVADCIGREVTTSKELTKAEASKLIDELESLNQRPNFIDAAIGSADRQAGRAG